MVPLYSIVAKISPTSINLSVSQSLNLLVSRGQLKKRHIQHFVMWLAPSIKHFILFTILLPPPTNTKNLKHPYDNYQ